MEALRELDHDGDGLIPEKDMAEFLNTLGESFSDEELTDFMKHATFKKKGNDNFIDIIKLTEVMMPRFSAREEILK